MALFNRRNNQNQVPAEIQEYYQTERRERAGVAWMLAIGTLIVTVLLAAGIFFAGRWAYRQVAGDDEPAPQTAQNDTQGDRQQEPADDTTNNQAQDQSQDEPADEPEQATPPADTQDDNEAPARDEPALPSDDTPDTTATNDRPTGGSGGGATSSTNTDETSATDDRQVAGAQTGKTPETGPGSTLAIFVAVSVLGYLAHRAYGYKK